MRRTGNSNDGQVPTDRAAGSLKAPSEAASGGPTAGSVFDDIPPLAASGGPTAGSVFDDIPPLTEKDMRALRNLRKNIKKALPFGYQVKAVGVCCLCFSPGLTKSVVCYSDNRERELCALCANGLMGEIWLKEKRAPKAGDKRPLEYTDVWLDYDGTYEEAEKPWLKIRLHDGEIRCVTTPLYHVGRADDNELVVGSFFVSRKQCVIGQTVSSDHLATLKDTSRQGTSVNDVLLKQSECFLKHGDMVGIGRSTCGTFTSYSFQVLDPALPEPAQP
jgi:hypothetical protein